MKARKAADQVLRLGPLRWGMDGRFWAYRAGVYVPGDDVVHARIVGVLGDRYRPAHGNAIRDVLRAIIPPIDCGPVGKYINFTNGLLDWQAQGGPKLLPHSPDVPSTVQLAVAWDPNAQCPLFREFLGEVVEEDDIPRVWEVLGYMLFSGNPLQRAFLLAGDGGNGKGVFMRVITALIGKEHISHVPLADFSRNRFAVAQLFGRMANICGDIDATYMENTGRFKEAVGEDEVNAEHKFGQPFRFTAWCSMLFSANEIPGSADSSRGWLRRWEVVSFPRIVTVPDRTLEPRLQEAGSLQGIAAGAVAALRVLMDRGDFRQTEAGRKAKEEFAQKSNALIQWIEDNCRVTGESGDFERGGLLYEDFCHWSEGAGLKGMSRPRFYEKLRQLSYLGVAPTKRKGIDGFKGIIIGKGKVEE